MASIITDSSWQIKISSPKSKSGPPITSIGKISVSVVEHVALSITTSSTL